MNRFFLLSVCMLLSSCATLFNKDTVTLTLNTPQPLKVIYQTDTVYSTQKSMTIEVKRSKEDLYLLLESDSIQQNAQVSSKRDPAFWLNTYTYGVGILVDFKNPKSYTYPSPLDIDIHTATSIVHPYKIKRDKIADYNKGKFFMSLNFPYINHYITNSDLPPNMGGGFLGIGTGAEYRYADKKSVEGRFDGALDFFIFVPAPVRYEMSEGSELTGTSTHFFSVSHKHRLNRVHLGYGLSYGRFEKYRNTVQNEEYLYERERYSTYGFVFPIHYQVGNVFRLGLLYRPTIYRPKMSPKFAYEHHLSIDFGFRIRFVK